MAASDYEVLDERFRDCVNRTSHVQKLWTGARWTEGPVYFPAGTLPPVLRHPERPHHALRRDRRLGRGLPHAVRLRQRPHRRPAGPARLVRARRPARLAHRDRRAHHGHRRQLPGQAAQLAERRGGEVRRLDLVHRSALRHPLRLRGPQGRRRRTATTSIASTGKAARSRASPTTSSARTGSRSRPTRRSSTSSSPPAGASRAQP